MKRKKVKFCFCVMMMLSFASRTPAKDTRVTTASQLSSAITAALPGDTITMANGVWQNITITFRAQGTAAANILLRAEKTGQVIISGTSTLKIAGSYLVVDGLTFKNGYNNSGNVIEFRNSGSVTTHCRLTNTSIIDYSHPDTTVDTKWVSLYDSHNRVDHCYFRGKRNLGTTLVVWLSASPNYHRIDHNYFAYRPVLGLNGGETIRVGTSDWALYDSYTTVEYNYFEECNGESEIISNKSCGNIFRCNTFVNCQGALTLRHGNRATVEGNFFFANHTPNSGGIRIIGEDHKVFNNYISGCSGSNYRNALTFMNGIPNSPATGYFQVKRALVVHNTMIDNDYSILMGMSGDSTMTLPPIDCTFANNIVYGTKPPLINFAHQPINMNWQSNIFYGTTTGFTTVPPGNLMVNPIFEAPDPYGVRRLSPLSLAINNTAQNYPFVTTDADGQPRDSIADIGCDEFSNEPIRIRPLRPQDVGPGSEITAVRDERERGTAMPDDCTLSVFPNPFNSQASIRYRLPRAGAAELSIYDFTGQGKILLRSGEQEPGLYSAAIDANAYHLSSGVYLIVLTFDGKQYVQRMLLLK